ncbi:MAG: hypothetical protein GX911_07545 [Spirochaetales bacterium]|nr:hypothetical protein [Spirochaetales bacterium]
MSVDLFMEQAERHLTARDWKTLRSAFDGAPSRHPMLESYRSFSSGLNTALARKRRIRLGFAPDDDLQRRTVPGGIEEVADELLGLSDPLEAEMALIGHLWKQIDRLVGLKVFEFDALLGYGLKLLLSERVEIFTREVGQATFETILGALRSEIDRM